MLKIEFISQIKVIKVDGFIKFCKRMEFMNFDPLKNLLYLVSIRNSENTYKKKINAFLVFQNR